MEWSEIFPQERRPGAEEIIQYINHPCYKELIAFIEEAYHLPAQIEYSKCSMARGWNVKYKKGGKSLCTVYPEAGAFYCMVVVGRAEAEEAETILPSCSEYIQSLYHNTQVMNGARWMMIEVSGADVLEDVKKLIQIRVRPKS